MEESELREQAKSQLEAKRGFWNFAVVYVVVNALLVVIWAVSDGGYFWPIWVIGGMGIALALNAWKVFGQKPITESDIQQEMQRQRQG
jgi:fatty acid desaturase